MAQELVSKNPEPDPILFPAVLVKDQNRWNENEDFREDQLLSLELVDIREKKKKEKSEPEQKQIQESSTIEISLLADAYHLRENIKQEWEQIVIGKKTGDFDHDMQLTLRQNDYFDRDVYERAWECYDLIKKLVESGSQKETLFMNYTEVYEDVQQPENHGMLACRYLVSLSRLLSRCLDKSVIESKEQIIESEIPSSSNIQNA